MQKFLHPRVALMTAASCLSLGLALGTAVHAQTAAPAASAADSDVVVVRGFRASLQSALTTKKKSNLMMESVAAEDMGKFPDQNISESLQRLPGIQIDRTNGQGTTVRIRGLSQNVTTLNGDIFLSGLELFRLGEGGFQNQKSLEGIPSDLIGSVDVYKSPDASLLEGGLGGIVNLKTRNARDFKGDNLLSVNLRMNEGTGTDWKPNASVVFGHKFGHDFAILGSLTYDKEFNRSDLLQGENRGTWAYLNHATTTTPVNVWSPEYRYTTNRNQERERTGYSLGAAWRVSDSLNLTADWFHSDLKIFTYEYSMKFPFNNEGATYSSSGLTVNQDGSLASGQVTANSQEGDTFAQNAEAKTDNVQLAANWDNGGDLTGKFRMAYSKTDYASNSGQVDERYTQYGVRNGTASGTVPNAAAPTTAVFTYTNGEYPVFTPSAANLAALTNPAAVFFKSHWAFGETNVAKDFATSADFKYKPGFAQNHDLVLSFGARYADAKLTYTYGRYLNDLSGKKTAGGDPEELPASAQGQYVVGFDAHNNPIYGASTAPGATFIDWTPYGYFQDGAIGPKRCDVPSAGCGRFGNGDAMMTPYATAASSPNRAVTASAGDGITAIFQDAQQMKDPVAWIQSLYPTTKFSFFADPLQSFKVDAQTTTGYLMADAGDASSGYHLNAGVRVVHTKLTADTSNTPAVPLWWGTDSWNGVLKNPDAAHTVREYTDVLPSVNAVFDINEHDKVRASGARVVSSQDLFSLGQGNSYNFTRNSDTTSVNYNKFIYTNGSGGNPNLDPYRANQFDLGYEHYFGKQGLIAATVFYKSVDSFITQNTYTVTVKDQSQAGATAGLFSSPVNGRGGSIKGLELIYETSWDNGFGVNANFTYSDSKSPFSNDYESNLPVPGVSKTAFNVQAYYEGHGFEGRLSYAWRDKSYSGNFSFGSGADTHSLGIWTRAYGQLDGSISYNLSPGLKLSLEGINLTKEASSAYLQFPDLPFRYQTGDQRIMVGIRYSFGG